MLKTDVHEASEKITEPKTYTRRQSASIFGISLDLLDKLIAADKIRSIKLGDRRLIPADEIHRVLREGIQ